MTKNDELRDEARGARGSSPTRSPWSSAGASTCRPTCRCCNEPDQRVVIATASERAAGRSPARGRVRARRRRPAAPVARLRRARRALGAVRGRPDAQLVPVRGRPGGRAVPHAEPEGRGRRRGAHDRRRAASSWSPPSSSWCRWRRREGELFTRWRVRMSARTAAPVACRRPRPASQLRAAWRHPVGQLHTASRRVRAARRRGRDVPVVEFKDVTKVYDGGSVGLERASMRIGRGEFVFLVGPTGCGKSTCIRLLMKELEPTQGRDLDRRPRRWPTCRAQRVPVPAPQHRRRLPGLQAAAEPHRVRQRRLLAPGDRRAAPGDPPQGAGHPAPGRPLDQAPQLPGRAVRRRAAARLDRARVREPPAAAAGRRADRQPRPRDLDRDHAADLPDQPHRHDRGRGHPRQRDGRQDAPARDRAARGPHRPRRALRPLPHGRVDHRVRDPPARRARRRRRGPPATRCAVGFFLREALRGLRAQLAPALGGAAARCCITAARARRLHPDRPGHDRHRERGAQPRRGRRLRQGHRDASRAAPSCAARARDAPPNVKSVEFISKERGAARARGARPEGAQGRRPSCSAPTRCPASFRVHARATRTSSRRSSPRLERRTASRSSRAIDEVRNREERHEQDPLGDRPREGAHRRAWRCCSCSPRSR